MTVEMAAELVRLRVAAPWAQRVAGLQAAPVARELRVRPALVVMCHRDRLLSASGRMGTVEASRPTM